MYIYMMYICVYIYVYIYMYMCIYIESWLVDCVFPVLFYFFQFSRTPFLGRMTSWA